MSEPTKQWPGDQPLPVVNDLPFVQDAVISDIEERKLLGIERYGTPLQAHNGRNVLQDLYEELIDGAMYAKQLLLEQEDTGVSEMKLDWSILLGNGQRILFGNREDAEKVAAQYLDSKIQFRSRWKDV